MENKKFKIMLVEDNQGDVWLAKEAFGRYENYEINVKSDGEEAIDYLLNVVLRNTESLPDLVLLDLNLPKKSGEEVLSVMKSNRILRLIPVVVMSTDDSPSMVNRVYELQTNCFIVKPVNVEDYFRVIDVIDKFWFKTVRLPFYEENI